GERSLELGRADAASPHRRIDNLDPLGGPTLDDHEMAEVPVRYRREAEMAHLYWLDGIDLGAKPVEARCLYDRARCAAIAPVVAMLGALRHAHLPPEIAQDHSQAGCAAFRLG